MKNTKVANSFQIYNASAGSGKTFTLVKEYLKILLQSSSNYTFQHILAITFTNKAAAEMKVRILESLYTFSSPENLDKKDPLRIAICEELEITPDYICAKSQKIIQNILNNYAAFNITTIDSFTYKLIKSFAFDLGLPLNFDVEMDAISLLNEAVDVLISRIGDDEKLTKTLIDFSIQKASEDKSWDIAFDLKEIAKLLLNENDILQLNKLKNKSISDFLTLKNSLQKQITATEKLFINIGNKAFELINATSLQNSDFASKDLPNHFKKLMQLNLATLNYQGRLAKNIDKDHHQYSGKATNEAKLEIDSIKDSLITLYFESKQVYEMHYPNYVLHKLISKSLIPLSILQSINSVLTEIKEDNNIRLISEFNHLISAHLKEQPAAFIYEKIGGRFRHYFIDEMQDTSVMQWENLIPLLKDTLESENSKGETGTLLLVGDAKQAIYRWRGGKAEQFIALADSEEKTPFLVQKKVAQLETNWRSYSEIIDFNNSFFQYLSPFLKKESYQTLYKIGNQQKQNDKKGGYVQLEFVEEGLTASEKEEVYPKKALEIIQNLTNEFNKNEICILTRTRKQGVAMAEYLTENNIAIISSETLLIQNEPKVQFIIQILRFIERQNDEEAKFEILYFLYNHLELTEDKHLFFTTNIENNHFIALLKNDKLTFNVAYFTTLPFYDSIEYIIRSFNLTSTSNAHLQFFLDVILEFSNTKNEGVSSFLNYWDAQKDKLSIVIPDGKDAIRIMTIHKAKGLEFPVVIYPFDLDIYKQINPKIWYPILKKEAYNGFDTALIASNSSLKETGLLGKKLYDLQREELELDNFNLLYVALTRAKEQLYIISEHKKIKDEPKHYSQFFSLYLQQINKWKIDTSLYRFGSIKRLSKKEKPNIQSKEQDVFISSDWRNFDLQISSKPVIEKDTTEFARQYGNLIHEILAKIIVKEDIDFVLTSFINKGLITPENQQEISERIEKIVTHSKLKKYFNLNDTILNEREISTKEGLLMIPDRLIISKNKISIIDYKTGKHEAKHLRQINNYAAVLQNMNYVIQEKLLVYISDSIEVELVN